jgi:hypothetical protein
MVKDGTMNLLNGTWVNITGEEMKKKKKAPKGYHYMPNGKLMKNSAMKKNKMKRY